MKIIIFAGGSGTRFWPLSRESYPKQFKQIFNGKSTLQLAVERIQKPFGIENIYISVNDGYINLVKKQIPQILESNIIGEPAKRNVAPAIGYNLIRLKEKGYKGPIAILWADHLMDNVQKFVDVLKKGEDLIKTNANRMVFIGEKPRYAENNLGWIHLGKGLKENTYEFEGWYYKPPLEKCIEMFESGEWVWNPGYFITDITFLLRLYEEYAPEMFVQMKSIGESIGTKDEKKILRKVYPEMESVSFDKKILEKLNPKQAAVIKTDMGWSDPGTLYALKEALQGTGSQNLVQGLAHTYNTEDSVIINEEKDKLITTIGLDGMVVANTKDALVVVHKDDVILLTNLAKQLQEDKKLKEYT